MSLRARILFLVLVASLLPILAMVWLLFDYRANSTREIREQLSVRTDRLATELGDRISGTGQLLFGLGRVPLLDSGDRDHCSRFLNEVLQEHPQYTGILTILPDGALLCDSLQSGRQLQLADRDYFKRASLGNGLVVEPVIGRLTGKPVLQIAYPVRDAQGQLKYVLLASLDMALYGQQAAASLPYRQSNLQIWSPDGAVAMDNPGKAPALLSPSAEQRQFMLSGAAHDTALLTDQAGARIWAKASVLRDEKSVLIIGLSVAAADLQQETERQFSRALVGLLGLAAITFLAAALLGELAVRKQTARLIRAVGRIDAGDFSSPIGQPYPRGELGQVMQSVDRLAASLEQQQVEILVNTEALERQARIDPLTGLANRHWLIERLNFTLDFARRTQRLAGVMMLDLDRFKMVNDSLGHNLGDRLLREIAGRLESCVRDGDTVARLGGDEFVVLISDVAELTDVQPLAQKILDALSRPVAFEGQTFMVSASLGIALYPQDGQTAGELLQYADTAMYRAKSLGGNTFMLFAPEMRKTLLQRVQIEAGLRQALAANDFCLHYQPIVDAASGRVVSAEALIRWHDPVRGLIPPAEFIPVAEETGLIIPIGVWVMREAMTQAKRWQEVGLDFSVAINLSARQFNTSSLDEVVAALLEETGCPATLLQFEITESMIMDQVENALATMHRLTRLGVRLMIDDFGTGYSSLSQLKRFPVSTLKIDASFVRDIEHGADNEALVDAIIALSRKMGLLTVAEGVETQGQADCLNLLGCDRLQGYYFARPVPAEAFVEFLRQRGEYPG